MKTYTFPLIVFLSFGCIKNTIVSDPMASHDADIDKRLTVLKAISACHESKVNEYVALCKRSSSHVYIFRDKVICNDRPNTIGSLSLRGLDMEGAIETKVCPTQPALYFYP